MTALNRAALLFALPSLLTAVPILVHFEPHIDGLRRTIESQQRLSNEQSRLLARAASLRREERVLIDADKRAAIGSGQAGILQVVDEVASRQHLNVRSLGFDARPAALHLEFEGSYAGVLLALDAIPRTFPRVHLDALALRKTPGGVSATLSFVADHGFGGS